MKTITYTHHGREVHVQEQLAGRHREHCLCYGCDRFAPADAQRQCPIADAVYKNCVKFNIVSPVWECPDFVPKVEGCSFCAGNDCIRCNGH